MQEICHDLEVHEIELEMQNEELIHTYQELDNSNKRYFDFYNLAPVGYLTLSEEGLILEANLTSSTLLGISTQILIQKPVSHFILQEDQDIYYLYNKSFSDQTKQPSCELRMLHSDGTSFWVQLESSTQNSDGIVLHRLIISPINERKKAQEELRIAAIAFKSQNGMAITDADGIIERINPAFTALTGYSEEEAATLANQLGEKIFESMQKPFFLKTRDYYAQMSIGVTLLNSDDTVEDLFKHADIALYQAKNSGRNTLRFFDPTMQATLDLHSALEAELREALSKNQFRLYYQPQVDELHRVGGVEALIRWLHPERGLISPDDFIPLAEESDLILPIGLWVLQSACEQLKIWKNNPYTAQLNVAVNVSSRQFRQPDFVAQIQQVLQNCGVNPSLLKLELTESLVLENVEETIQKMAAIQHLGVNFSMDDFGTGFSSLSYLAQLPLNQLKIDKSFVNKIFEHRDNEMIARTIIAMGIGLGMNVIAEGVETIAQQKFLEASGCLFYQGYLFSRPLPIEELEVYLQQN